MSQHSKPLDLRVLTQALDWVAEQPVWLCTVLHTWGSSPRSPGAMLVAKADGQFVGSLSGGCIEEHFLAQIGTGCWQQPSQIVRYGDGELAPQVRLPCGGILDLLVEYLPAGSTSVDYLQRQQQAINGFKPVKKSVCVPRAATLAAPAVNEAVTRVETQAGEIHITLAAAPRLLVAGYSPVAQYCMEFAIALGFEVILCEPREEQLAMLSDLPANVHLESTFPAYYLSQQGCHANTAIVSLTHDPRLDDLTMMEAVHTPAFYIGVMGSKLNSATRRDRLTRLSGMTDAQLARIHAPIGLAIGSKTPAEIALAIMADIVRVKNHVADPL